jgi:hypothetical protein
MVALAISFAWMVDIVFEISSACFPNTILLAVAIFSKRKGSMELRTAKEDRAPDISLFLLHRLCLFLDLATIRFVSGTSTKFCLNALIHGI